MEKRKRGGIVFSLLMPALALVLIAAALCISYGALAHRISPIAVLIALIPMLAVAMLTHEIGHLLVALACGWRFVSISALSFTVVSDGGGLRLKRSRNPITQWQCLCSPDDEINAKKSTILVNLGGFIGNACTFLLFAAFSVIFIEYRVLLSVLYTGAVLSLAVGVENLIPMRTGLACNDGYNALSARGDGAALSTVRLIRINAHRSEARLRDMPDGLFVYDEAQITNVQTAALAYQAFVRKMDQGDFDGAYALGMRLLGGEADLLPLYRGLLSLDMTYICAVAYRDPVLAGSYVGDGELRIMKLLSSLPSVQRTRYAYALSIGDGEFARRSLDEFRKAQKRYYPRSEMQSERELIALADKVYGVVPKSEIEC